MAEIENLLHGDLEVRIINEDDQVTETGIFYQYSGRDGQTHKLENKSVHVLITPGGGDDDTVGFAAIYRNFNDSAGELSLRISVAHHLSKIEFRVGFQLKGVVKYSGKATVDSKSIGVDREFNMSLERQDSRGWWKTAKSIVSEYFNWKLGDPKPVIRIKLEVKFTPCIYNSLYKNGIWEEYALAESYFPLRQGGKVTLYQDAHCMSDLQLPKITLENGMIFNRGTCWEDIFHAIFNAKHVVYIVGWAISPEVRLVREPTRTCDEDIKTLGDLLKYKSGQGVKVRLLVWDDITSLSILGVVKTQGIMKTGAKETLSFFKETSVECVLIARDSVATSTTIQRNETKLIFSHHQKCVIVDKNNQITAFIGGLDLFSGRYDTPQHRLYGDQDTVFEGDFVNPTFPSGTTAPREPWHDLHCKIEGPAAYDVLNNFEQRWQAATQKVMETVLNGDDPLSWVLQEDNPDRWNVQVFRSIDSGSVKDFTKFDTTAVEALVWEENVVKDRSIQMAYIQAIRSAQHFIYIENQYFIGSLPSKQRGGVNLIPLELALKIASKIRTNEEFRVYVVIPMWPEGDPKSDSIQHMLYLQSRTMQMMYEIIADAIMSTKLENVAHPTDYLNFYCLGKREIPPQDKVNDISLRPSHKYRRFMIYVHSKAMIVDDAYVILGSANINHRSMDGSRDTEIAMGAYQPHFSCRVRKSNIRGARYMDTECPFGRNTWKT